jgi:integrase/recombinase XerD
MTPLRQRMIEDLRMRNRSSGTISAYVAHVALFAKFYGRSPEDLSQEDVRAYLLRIIKQGRICWSHYNVIVCALRFLYRVTLCKDWPMERLPYAKRPKKLPTVLSPAEVVRLLECVSQLRHRMVLMTMYATGLRVSEAIRLRAADIDSQRMLVHVRQGKGGKDRMVPLAPVLLEALRQYWRIARPGEWLFPGRGTRSHQHVQSATVARACAEAAQRAGLSKRTTPHTLRHSFATHLMEANENIRTIQALLGHRQLRTTAIYTHVTPAKVQSTPSPLQVLAQQVSRLVPSAASPGLKSARSSDDTAANSCVNEADSSAWLNDWL